MKAIISGLCILLTSSLVLAQTNTPDTNDANKIVKATPAVTFIELGSVNCIPCKKMQPVMKSIEERYGNQIKVVFYDIGRSENKEYSVKYRVQAIPTQVFLDEKGIEFSRHMGYFDEKSINKILQSKGLTPIAPEAK